MSNRPQTQADRRRFLIAYLLAERPEWKDTPIPEREDEQRTLLRSLMNVRNPLPASEEFLRIQDEYLREVNKSHGITSNKQYALYYLF